MTFLNVTDIIFTANPQSTELLNLNFLSLEFVSRYRDSRDRKLSDLSNLSPNKHDLTHILPLTKHRLSTLYSLHHLLPL